MMRTDSIYIMAGLPDMEGCKERIKEQERAGAGMLELGIPFSDPTADVPEVQEKAYQAIEQGTNLKKVFAMMKELREEGAEIPVVFVMYYNTVLQFGLEKFTEECIKSGVNGLRIQDLPRREQGELHRCWKEKGQE